MDSRSIFTMPGALEATESIWDWYFRDKFYRNDGRLGSIGALYHTFEREKTAVLSNIKASNRAIYMDIKWLQDIVPFDNFYDILKNQPSELIGCMVKVYTSMNVFFLA